MDKLWLNERIRLWLRAFVLRDMDAMHALGAWHGSGNVGGISRTKALNKACYYYRKAAANGHAESQYDLGFMIIESEIVGYDYYEGIKLIKKSAEAGFLPAEKLIADIVQHNVNGG